MRALCLVNVLEWIKHDPPVFKQWAKYVRRALILDFLAFLAATLTAAGLNHALV